MTVDISDIGPEHEDFLRDESRRVGSAESISFPETEDEVKEALAEARERGMAVTIQGARTGIAGGAVPEGGHVLNLGRMNRIVGARHDAETGCFFVSVQPGVLLADLREALSTRGIDAAGWSDESLRALEALKEAEEQFFPPDPTETSASLGGMVANNASGAKSFHYGPTRDHIEALRVVLADGSAIRLSRGLQKARGRTFRVEMESGRVIEGALPDYTPPPVKSAAGYHVHDDMDLLDLFVGMEGTLGVITEMELRLSPAPKAMWGMTAFLPSEESALRFVRSARGESVEGLAEPPPRPVAIEFFNGAALDLLRRQRAENPAFSELPDLPESSHTAVYVEYHGDDEDAVADAVMAACDVLTALGGDEDATWVASDERERERLAAFRHATPEAVNLLIDERRKAEPSLTKLGTDMSVPDEHLERVMALYNNGLADAGLEAVIFGHIGDNHVHVNILPRTFEDYAKGKALYLAWAREVVEMGGSVSAEHGIGKLKPAMLKLMAGEDGIERMRALKRLFDPAETLNPGNLFGE